MYICGFLLLLMLYYELCCRYAAITQHQQYCRALNAALLYEACSTPHSTCTKHPPLSCSPVGSASASLVACITSHARCIMYTARHTHAFPGRSYSRPSIPEEHVALHALHGLSRISLQIPKSLQHAPTILRFAIRNSA